MEAALNTRPQHPRPQLRIPPERGETRTSERLLAHYEIEREQADRLRRSSGDERRALYTQAYDEVFRRVSDHPMLHAANQAEPPWQAWNVRFLQRFLRPDTVYLEVGPGDCSFARQIAREVARVYAVDVTDKLLPPGALPPNVDFVLSDGSSIPVAPGSVDLVFSNQLMEHLHADDAAVQLSNIFNALKPGGHYVCITPNRLYGPSDVSQYFSETATGFHLKEYSFGELHEVFGKAGFRKVTPYVGARNLFMPVPRWPIKRLERMIEHLPYERRKRIAGSKPFRALLGLRLVARKPLDA